MGRPLALILSALAGLAAGMLVNLGADLLPNREAVAQAVRCPQCGGHRPQLRWPSLLGFLAARRCTFCGHPLRWRALLVELAMALLWAFGWSRFGPSPRMWLLALHGVLFALIFIIDLEHRLVLNRVILAGTVLSLVASLLWRSPPPGSALLGGATGMVLFLLVALAKPGGMGMGDVKLAALIGLVMGFPGVLTALAAGVVTGGLGSLALLLSRRAQRKSYIPYAPFLVSGAVAGLLQGVPW